jgi:hypothetical protein
VVSQGLLLTSWGMHAVRCRRLDGSGVTPDEVRSAFDGAVAAAASAFGHGPHPDLIFIVVPMKGGCPLPAAW